MIYGSIIVFQILGSYLSFDVTVFSLHQLWCRTTTCYAQSERYQEWFQMGSYDLAMPSKYVQGSKNYGDGRAAGVIENLYSDPPSKPDAYGRLILTDI